MKQTYIVSGHPRTGTSMMMRGLHAGGLDAVWNPERDKLRNRFGDKHYATNRGGMYELLDRELKQPEFPRMYEGKLIKVLSTILPSLVAGDYLVVFMRREWEAVKNSYEAFFGGKLRVSFTGPSFQGWQDDYVGIAYQRLDMHVTEMQFDDVSQDPEGAFASLAESGWPIDPERAAAEVRGYKDIPAGAVP